MSNEYLTSGRVNLFRWCFLSWGAGQSATRAIKQQASKKAENNDESYSDAITYIRTGISFALFRNAINLSQRVRGSKRPTDIDSLCGAIVLEVRLGS